MYRIFVLCWICLTFAWVPNLVGKSSELGHARSLIATGKLDQAVETLRGIVKAAPDDFDARMLLGTTLAIQGARSESIQQVLEAVKLRPQSAEAYDLLGTTLSRFMETADATSAFEHAIQLDPALAEAHVNLALLLAEAGDWVGAGEHLDRALILQMNTPPSAYSHYLRAKTYIAQSQFEKAAAELEHAIAIRPKFAEAWSDLGWTRLMLNDDTGAMKAFARSIQLNPKDPLAQYRLGTACLRDGQTNCAIEHLRASLKWGGADKPTLYNLERALRKAGNLKEAQQVRNQMESQEAIRISSENALLISRLNTEGMDLEKQGDFQGATKKYRMALDLDPTADGIRLNYGLSLCRLHDWHDGIAEIQEVLRLDPDNGAAARAFYIAKEQAQAEAASAK